MERSFWLERWETGKLGFHADAVNPNLLAHADALTGGTARSVLVPLCGKTLDLAWLASAGHRVVGVELIELAAQQFFSDNELDVEVATSASGHPVYRGQGIEIHVADFFQIEPVDVGSIDAAWDRAALVALPETTRGAYCAKLRELVAGPILLNTFTYDQSLMDGPPFSIEEQEVRAHYEGKNVELRGRADVIDNVPFKDRGLTSWLSSVYLID